jgi:16S rRNA (guanine966-N2)-methyltransferase
MGVEEDCTIISGDAFRVLKKLALQGYRADLITADPPYDSELTDRILQTVADSGIMVPGGWLVVEHGSGEMVTGQSGFTLIKSRKLGDTVISIWEWSPD